MEHVPFEAVHFKQPEACALDAQQRPPTHESLVHSLSAEQDEPVDRLFFAEHLDSVLRKCVAAQMAHLPVAEAHAMHSEAYVLEAQQLPPMQEVLVHSISAPHVPAIFFGEHLDSEALRK